LLIEDEELLRALLIQHIQLSFPDWRIIETGNGLDAWEIFKRNTPSHVILDLKLPGLSGGILLKLMAEHHMAPRVMVLTGQTPDQETMSMQQQFSSLIWMEKGESLGKVHEAMVRFSAAKPINTKPGKITIACDGVPNGNLTHRESMVLSLIGSGCRYREIAGVLGISLHTVHVHRRNIMRKLQLNSSAQLAVYAVKNGFNNHI
jgi:two-component system nitrate/nitrite response regulator NarL